MAVSNRSSTPTAKQAAAAERAAMFTAEQRRLKAAAADRRAAAVTDTGEQPEHRFVAVARAEQGPPTVARPSKYLQ